ANSLYVAWVHHQVIPQVAPLLDLHCVNGSPHVHHFIGQLSVESNLHIGSKCAFALCCLGSLPH
ncbi:unnamed protein product, partial [Musa textilis]